jgi:hypothetical protein
MFSHEANRRNNMRHVMLSPYTFVSVTFGQRGLQHTTVLLANL